VSDKIIEGGSWPKESADSSIKRAIVKWINDKIRKNEALVDQITRIKRGNEVVVEKEKIFHQQSVMEKVKG
jgi:hypothetical protein